MKMMKMMKDDEGVLESISLCSHQCPQELSSHCSGALCSVINDTGVKRKPEFIAGVHLKAVKLRFEKEFSEV